ncbi:MAG: TlpA family protein disulfide reductase [Acidimicrobiia bacterium]
MARQSKAAARAQKKAELERQRREAARKRAIRNTAFSIGGAVLLVVIGLAVWPKADPADAAADEQSNTTAEGWDLPQLDGPGRVRLADFRGKPTVAAFFANWCEVCEEEIPELLTLSQVIGDDVNFVGINMMDNARGLPDAERWGIAGVWPLARDVGNGNNSSLATRTFGARGSPLHVIYDAEGQVLTVRNGYMGPNDIVNFLSQSGQLES